MDASNTPFKVTFQQRIFRRLVRLHKDVGRNWKRFYCSLYGQIYLAPRAIIEPNAKLIIDYDSSREKTIAVGEGTIIKDFALICPRSGFIEIGRSCSINSFCVLLGYGGITIGNHVRIAAHTSIIAFNHNFENVDKKINHQGYRAKGIVIEDDVWIASGVRILDGVRVGRGAVVGAGAVVNKDVEPYTVVGGVPAKILKQRDGRNVAKSA